MSHLANLTRWEWFKLRRRWMPWILLVILLLFSQLFLWSSFFSYQGMERSGPQIGFAESTNVDCYDLVSGGSGGLPPGLPEETLDGLENACRQAIARHEPQLEETRSSFMLPASLPTALNIAHSIGLMLIAILAASVIGTEYAWGTLRTSLVRGSGRWQYLAGKLGMLALLGGAALLVVVVLAMVSSALAGLLSGGGVASAGGEWSSAASMFARSWFGLLPFIALAAAVTVLSGSSAAGIGISLAYNFVEQIAVAILLNLFEWFETVADYLLGRNITAWMLGGGDDGAGFIGAIGDMPGQWHAFAVMAVYTLALGALAFWLFQKRDIKGANGG
ncbi:MAG: ABC transporter permease subunit [Dehalococcoidia bacterium]